MALSATQRVSGQTAPQVSNDHPISTRSMLLRVPYEFVRTLVEPITSPKTREFFQKQFSDWRNDVRAQGVLGYVRNAVRECPLDVLSKLALLSGIGNFAGENGQFVVSLIQVTNVFVQQAAFLKSTADAIDAEPALKNQVAVVKSTTGSVDYDLIARKAMKISLYGGMVYLAASFPAAAAALDPQLDTFADLRRHYSGKCSDEPLMQLMKAPRECLTGDSVNLQECCASVPDNVLCRVTVYARQISNDPALDPVITTKVGREVCITTALDPAADATKVCFPDLKQPSNRTVTRLPATPLSRAHEMLNPGDTQIVLEMGPLTKQVCADFIKVKPDYATPPEFCLVTKLEEGGKPSQICVNPKRLTEVTLREGPDIDLPGQTGPTSVLYRDPVKSGLNYKPETSEAPCVETGGVHWYDAFLAWFNQKWPCAKTETPQPVKKEL